MNASDIIEKLGLKQGDHRAELPYELEVLDKLLKDPNADDNKKICYIAIIPNKVTSEYRDAFVNELKQLGIIVQDITYFLSQYFMLLDYNSEREADEYWNSISILLDDELYFRYSPINSAVKSPIKSRRCINLFKKIGPERIHMNFNDNHYMIYFNSKKTVHITGLLHCGIKVDFNDELHQNPHIDDILDNRDALETILKNLHDSVTLDKLIRYCSETRNLKALNIIRNFMPNIDF